MKDIIFGTLCGLLILGYVYFFAIPMARLYFSWEGRIEKLEKAQAQYDTQFMTPITITGTLPN